MTYPIYTAGYALREVGDLFAQARSMKAHLLDIRLHAVSSKPGWKKEELAARFRSRYRHVPALGNLGRFVAAENAYAGGDRGIRIANLSEGLLIVEDTLTTGPVILLCGCRDESLCHRRAVGDSLRERGYAVSELPLHSAPHSVCQMSLSEFAESGRVVVIYSDMLKCQIVLAADNAILPLAEMRPVYRARELAGLEKWTADGLRLLHETKTVFGGDIEADNGKRPVPPTADMFTVVEGGGERLVA